MSALEFPPVLVCDCCGTKINTTRPGAVIRLQGAGFGPSVSCAVCARLDAHRAELTALARYFVSGALRFFEPDDLADVLNLAQLELMPSALAWAREESA